MMASCMPGALRIQQGQTESLISWTSHSIGSQTGKQTNEHTNPTKRLWRKSKSVINGDSDAEGWGWGQWSGMAFWGPDIWDQMWVKEEAGRIWGKGALRRALRPNWVEPVKGQAEALWGWRPWGSEEELRNKGNCALGNRNQIWGAVERSTKLLQILAGEDTWT